MSLDWNWVLIVAGALLVLIEVLLGGFAGFDMVLIGSCLSIGGGFGLLLGSPVAGVAVASALSLAYIAAGRRWVRGRMKHRTVPSNVDAVVGHTYLLAGRAAEALPMLTRASASCYGLRFPVEPMRAVRDLGVARAATGDRAGACAALRQVVDRWGHATPRSVTAEDARARLRALGCG